MKIIVSMSLLKAAQANVASIVRSVAQATEDVDTTITTQDIDLTVDKLTAETVSLKHFAVYRSADDCAVFEISDALIIRVYELYSHLAHHLCSAFMFMRPMFGMLTREMKAIDSMVLEERE